DALRYRHQQLPATAPYKDAPMAGATLAMHQGIGQDLGRLWDRWLHVMEVWDKAQTLAKSGGLFNVERHQEAHRMLAEESKFREGKKEQQACIERLDRLEHGHDEARAAYQSATDGAQKLKESLGRIAAQGIATDSYQAEVDAIRDGIAQGQRLQPNDPIGARA